MKKYSNIALFLIILLALIIIIGCTSYNIGIGSVSKNSTLKDIEITSGNSYLTISKILKDNNLIKSENFYKLYIKLFKPTKLEACTYKLSENMGVKKIVEVLEKGCNTNPDAITVTIPEGRHIEQIAEIVASKTNNTKEQLLNVWNKKSFIDEVIEKYEFVTEEVKDPKIRYALEGYLFPSTYELLNKDVTPEYIAYRMLDQMKVVYNKYKEDIVKSKYTFHEILTMASIVEYEAILDEDRALIAGVFYNRLNTSGWKLESCATLGYAIGEWKITYNNNDMKVASPYNTYLYGGLPVGPGGMAGEKSIEAAIYPQTSDYMFFMANVCDTTSKKTYFSKTLAEHEAKARQYLTCF